MRRKLSIRRDSNCIIWGDCKDWVGELPKDSVDLCYIDPPWFTKKYYQKIWKNGFERRAYDDFKSGKIDSYMAYMEQRIGLLKACGILKDTGFFVVHCDHNANYQFRRYLNELFGEKNFLSEVITQRTSAHNSVKNKFGPIHETLLIYKMSKNSVFHINKIPYKQEYIDKEYKHLDERRKLFFKSSDSTCPSENGTGEPRNFNGRIIAPYNNRTFPSQKTIDKLLKEDMYWFNSNGFPRKKDFEGSGIKIQSIWTDTYGKDFIGYPTQKPREVLKRIIEATTSKGEMVLDLFGGGGTTAIVANELQRKFIIGDISPIACRVQAQNLREQEADFKVKTYPLTKEQWLSKGGYEFQEMICEFMGWEVTPRGNSKFDGFSSDGQKMIPVEIKNWKDKRQIKKELRVFKDKLEETNKFKTGIFVAWDIGVNGKDYIDALKRNNGTIIEYIPVHEIIGDLLLSQEDFIKHQKLYEEAILESKHKKDPFDQAS